MFQLGGEVKFGVGLEDSGGKQLLLGPGNIRSLSIIESKNSLLPECQLIFEDMEDVVAKALMGDGAKVKVMLAPDSQRGDLVAEHTFRIFSTPGVGNTMIGKSVMLTGVADNPAYWRNLATKAYEGNSSDVISKVAREFGFQVDVDATSDKMTWLPKNIPIAQWLRDVSEHGYRGGESFMKMVVTDIAGKFGIRYKDVSKQMKESPAETLSSLGLHKTGDVPILFHQIISESGFNNNVFGYNSQTGQQKLSGEFESPKDVVVALATKALEMNSSVKKLVELGFRDWLPPETGNTFNKYAEARNQNRRLSSTFSVIMSAVVTDYTRVSLLDPVNVRIPTVQGDKVDETYSGKYLVTGRTRHIQGKFYRERLTLESQGVNQDSGGRVS